LCYLKYRKPAPNVTLSAAKHLDRAHTLVMLREILRYAQGDSQDAGFYSAARRNIFGLGLVLQQHLGREFFDGDALVGKELGGFAVHHDCQQRLG
jgi:hypothetical protein